MGQIFMHKGKICRMNVNVFRIDDSVFDIIKHWDMRWK